MSAPYEKSDVNIRSIVLFTVALVVTTAFGMWLMVWMFGALGEREDELDRAIPRATRVPVELPQHPPEPVIQGAPGSRFELQHPMVEMHVWRETEQRRLTTSAWVDRNARTVRIPIEHAKLLLLERGIAVRDHAAPGEGPPGEGASGDTSAAVEGAP